MSVSHLNQLILDIRPDAPPGFDNFLSGANAEALAAVLEHATGVAREPVLYLWGESGTGKTHLLRAWCAATGAVQYDPLPEPPLALVAVDGVERLASEEQIRLFSLINAAREGNARVLVTGSLPPGQLADSTLRPDLATRLAHGLVFRLHALSDTDKRAALTVRANARGLNLPEEVLSYLLTRCRRDLPHLLGLVDRLDTLSISRKRAASLPLLKELLQQSSSS